MATIRALWIERIIYQGAVCSKRIRCESQQKNNKWTSRRMAWIETAARLSWNR